MQASLYDWIVYQRRYKARERKGEKEDGWCGRLIQISCEGRQGASGNRDNRRKQYHIIQNYTRQYKTVYAVTLPPPLEKLALKLYMSIIISMGRSYLYALLVAYCLYYTSILSIYLGTLVVQVYWGNGYRTPVFFGDYL